MSKNLYFHRWLKHMYEEYEINKQTMQKTEFVAKIKLPSSYIVV